MELTAEQITAHAKAYAERRPGIESPLSGEYADDLTPGALVRELGFDESDLEHEEVSWICDTWEVAYFVSIA